MSRTLTLALLAFALLCGQFYAPTAAARQDSVADRVYEKYREREERGKKAPKARISLDQATNMVRRRSKGKVIGSSTSRRGNSIVHRIKVLSNGRVRTWTVDAVTGEIR